MSRRWDLILSRVGFFFYFLQIRLLLSIAAVATGRAASCICSPVTRHVLFLVIPTSNVPPAFKLLILFSVTKCRRQKTTQIIKSIQLTSSTRIGVFRMENRKSSGLDYKIHNSHLCPVPPLFFGQARLPLPQGFDGSEQYFWICDGSCGAFYLDDFISDFTGQRAYAIWNGIAFLAGSNIFCHSSKSLLLGQPKTLFHAIGT